MLYSVNRPVLAPRPEPPLYDRNHSAGDYYHQPNHSQPSSSSSAHSSSPYTTASSDRFEYRTSTLIASLLESRLSSNPLVRDCCVIGVPSPSGLTLTSSPNLPSVAFTTPIAFISLSTPGRTRSAQGGEKESKRMKAELTKHLTDFAPPFKAMKGRVMFLESIPRASNGAILRHLLVEKATSPPAPSPDKGFFNTVLSPPSSPSKPTDTTEEGTPKKPIRDSKRRATHSQIERRRREKINDRLVTLRSIVPACALELDSRRRQKQEEDQEAARIAAGGAPKTYIDAATGKPKRKRNRKRPEAKKAGEEELGLHKLEVLTHAINYIFELKARIDKLETGREVEYVGTADNPFGVRNRDGSYRQDAKVEDEPGEGLGARTLVSAPKNEDDEEDQLQDGDVEEEELSSEQDEPVEEQRASKKPHINCSSSIPFIAPLPYRRRDTYSSSTSSRNSASAECSPAFSIVSPATSITSPLMSLSASSPILLPDPAVPISSKRLPLAGGRRESSSFLFKHLALTSPSFPSRTYGGESEVRQTMGTGLSDATSAAELLLNFSTSPEVLRPTRSPRQEEQVALASPPHLALDEDRLSDKTIEEIVQPTLGEMDTA